VAGDETWVILHAPEMP